MMNCTTGRGSGVATLKIAALATVAASAFTLPGFENKAHAQAIAPVADVCTGLNLNETQLTNLLGAVNQPIVTPIENTVNGVLDILGVVDTALPLVSLGILSDLNIDVTTIVSDAVAGNPVSVQLVDSSGTVLGAGECNLAADAYTLNNESGIQIGGNQISGLGANGQAASAGELDAIAFGNNASTAAGATGAIALGTNASVTAPNSVALGANSVADRANIVSVGAAGAERQITNVAAGTAPTDVATVGQVDTAITAATAPDAEGTTPSTVPTDTVAFVAASGSAARVTNVAAGAISATSTDAINSSQMYAMDERVTQNGSDITTIRNNVEGSTVAAVQYSDPDNPNVSNGGTITNDVALVGADFSTPVVLHHVANGALANDAANIGQLQAGLADVMATSMGYTDTRVMEAMAYTDMRVSELSFDLTDLRDDAFSGTAAAMAMSAIPQAIDPSKSTIGGGVGHYRGQTAFGFGYSGLSGDGKMSFNVRGTLDTHGKGGVAAGAGFHF